MAHIRLQNVSLLHPNYGREPRNASEEAIDIGGRTVTSKSGTATMALSDLSLDLRDGDRVAVVGSNGSGKSTLLKMLAGVYEPSMGACEVQGEVRSLFNIYYGMDDDTSGLEYYFLRGYFEGARKKDLIEALPRARAFAGLGRYFDMPMRTYSDGMRLRLAFSIATMFEPEVLLLDEIFGVGDQAFFDKATRRLIDLSQGAGVTVFATHWLELAERFCNLGLWLHHGEVRKYGPIKEVFAEFHEHREAIKIAQVAQA
jgi:ABC-type polysaccharide/polyol phosphate transport system ATPase subunit